MTTPPEDGAPPYGPPYGSAPAYSDGGYGGQYGQTPAAADPPSAEQPPVGQSPASEKPSDATTDQPPVYSPPVAPAAPGRSRRAPALLLIACLLSGAVGGGVVYALEGHPAAATTPAAAGLTRGTATAPQTATAGTAQAAAATISPSVVTIAVTGQTAGTANGGGGQVSDTGSGIVLRADGYIVTNNHVIAAAASGGTVNVTFSDGSTLPAKIVGTDATSDLGVIKVDKTGLTAAGLADSDKLVVGQPVLAVGAPLGLSNTVTQGIVSTLHRPVRTGEQGATEQSVIDAVQTDAAINPGNSGGALVDLAGQVVGVNSAIASTGDGSSGGQSGNIGVGFAIPSNDVAEVSKELITSGRASHPQIGISVGSAAGAANGTPGQGALIRAVAPGGPAAGAGLQQGDIITKIGDRAVTDANSLIVAIRSHNPGDTVPVTYLRNGAAQMGSAALTEAPVR